MDECILIQTKHSTKLYFEKEVSMGTDTKSIPVRVDAGIGIFWFIGWLFTIAFAKLIWWQILLGLVVWPYFLGLAAR